MWVMAGSVSIGQGTYGRQAKTLGGLFTIMGSMIADVGDLDEIATGERREGMFGSVFWWMVKLGQSGAIVLGGFLLYSTGLDVSLGANQPEGTILWLRFYDAFVPLVASAIAIYAVYRYPITEESAGKGSRSSLRSQYSSTSDSFARSRGRSRSR